MSVRIEITLTIDIDHELVNEGTNEEIDKSYDELSAKIRPITDAIEGTFALHGWGDPRVDVDVDPSK